MNNDLEKLTHELEKIGLNKERLLHDEGSDDRCPALKHMHHSQEWLHNHVNTHFLFIYFLDLNFWRPNWSPL